MGRGSVIPLTEFIHLVQEVDSEFFCSYLENTGWGLGLKGIVFKVSDVTGISLEELLKLLTSGYSKK